MVHETEVHAYKFILDQLEKKEWSKDQILTQNEIRNVKPIVEQLGDNCPENIVEISPTEYYVIEGKSKRSRIKKAISEAREDYADEINKSKKIKAKFITGVAGNNKEGFTSTSQFNHADKWVTITENDAEVTSILSKSEIERILRSDNPHLKDVEISEEEFIKVAEEINGILHENAIHKDYRARFISAILLSLSDKATINLEEEPIVLVNSINSKVDLMLKKQKKEDFSRFIHIDLPSSVDNHLKIKIAIVKSVQELLGLNIHSAMKSGKDILGGFYEAVLKYGNGAKEIGIVLTPRHITHFAAEVLDVQPSDIILDPTCGTGGFLVAAFDRVKKICKNEGEFGKFTDWGLYGIEEQDPIIALALVNMIFRGDGKNNIIEGDCFRKWLNAKTRDGIAAAEYLKKDEKGRIPPVTKVLMNPPFPKKKTDTKEYLFIEQALKQMQDEGVLFSVIPYPCLIKSGNYFEWRKRMLKENTLLSVITFPEDLFYPIGVHTAGIFIKKGVPHPKNQNVFWIRAINDGRRKSKGKRLKSDKVKNDFEKIEEPLKSFIKKQSTKIKNITRFQKACPIDYSDKLLELVPENYLDEEPPKMNEIQEGVEQALRSLVSYMIRNKKEEELD